MTSPHQRPESGGVWRWADDLEPVDPATRISLGEGRTPLIDVSRAFSEELGGARLLLKAEHLNPTGSFKDRVAAIAVAVARTEGLRGVVGTSSGNGGAAIAAYAAAARLPAVLLVLPDAPTGKVDQIVATGASVHPIAGLGTDAAGTVSTARAVMDCAGRHGWLPFLTGARFVPEIMSGAKTIAFEVAEECPEATRVYAPVGGGGLVCSLARGYAGRDVRPALRAVQPDGCPTVRHALGGGDELSLDRCSTGISGLQVAVMFDDVPAALSQPNDALVEVGDRDARAAQARLARHGIFVEAAGATAVAGVLRDLEGLSPDDTVVAIATGAGWKAPGDFRTTRTAPLPAVRTVSDIPSILAETVS